MSVLPVRKELFILNARRATVHKNKSSLKQEERYCVKHIIYVCRALVALRRTKIMLKLTPVL